MSVGKYIWDVITSTIFFAFHQSSFIIPSLVARASLMSYDAMRTADYLNGTTHQNPYLALSLNTAERDTIKL